MKGVMLGVSSGIMNNEYDMGVGIGIKSRANILTRVQLWPLATMVMALQNLKW